MLKTNTKLFSLAALAMLLMATSAMAQGPGYQWLNAAAYGAEGQDTIYFCEDDGLSYKSGPMQINDAAGFFCCGTEVTHKVTASLTEDCATVVAESSVTAEAGKFYYITLVGNHDPENQAPNPDGQDTSLRFVITETDATHAAHPTGTPGLVSVTLGHLSPDLPSITGIVDVTGTVLPLGPFGTVTPLPVPFPSVLGAVNIAVHLESNLAMGDSSSPILTVPIDLATVDARGVMAAVTGYANPSANKVAAAPPITAIGVLDDGTVLTLAGGGGDVRNVSLWLNTSSIPDTTDPAGLVEVRGAVGGVAPFTLPDGNVINWNDESTLEPTNVGGDYWHIEFQIPNDSTLEFKFYNQQAEDLGIGGWEDGDNHVIPAGTGDVDMGMHFFNKTGGTLAYDWRPYEEKADSIAIWFRTYMNTEVAIQKGYDRATSMVGIRGDSANSGGAIDWDVTKAHFAPEGDTDDTPGNDLFSGVIYFPMSAAGNTQPFKYFLEPDGWEDSADRTFTVPAQDTTLHWTLFSDSKVPLGEDPVTAFVLMGVDLSPMEAIGIFDLARGDTLEARGNFNGWDCIGDGAPDDCLLERVPGEVIFEAAIAITAFPLSDQTYKYYLNLNDEAFEAEFGESPPSGWEEPLSTTGADRRFVFEGDPDNDQDLGVFFFDDILPYNIIEGDGSAGSKTAASVDVTFTVDMTEAIADPAAPFNPATDTVTIDFTGDEIWAFTQGVPRNDEGAFQIDHNFFSLAAAGGNLYSGTFTLRGPSYAAIQYKYAYTQGDAYGVEGGGTTSGLGRRRTRFVERNPDGTFPAEWAFPEEAYQPAGNLPFESNPAVPTAVEDVGTEIPSAMTLGANYPNPFNPTTSFEYSVTSTEYVTVKVFDLTGQLVATLVDGVQPASTYRVSFEAGSLASGVYIYQLQTPTNTMSKKMLLLK